MEIAPAAGGSGVNPTATAVAWIGGSWGAPEELQLPLADRGLQLADGLFETVWVEGGRPQLLQAHLRRWHHGAQLLGMAPPPTEAALEPLLQEAIGRAGGQGALRLNWSRGNHRGRGLDLPEPPPMAEQHRFWLQLTPCRATFTPLTAIVSRQERRNGSSLLSRCKTFAYGQAIQARREARGAGADEALLLGNGGELSCGASANVLVQRRGRWLTPALDSGCLAGVMRGRLLELGLAAEARLEAAAEPGDRWLLINSLSCRPVLKLEGQPLGDWPGAAADAERLWRRLLVPAGLDQLQP
jgi:4-amino-4-deoxychorismate lyase